MEDKRRTYGDEASPQITPIEMHLSSEWNRQEVVFGRLYSKFEKVQNYLFTTDTEEKMLTIMCEGNSLLPDSIILSSYDYEKLKETGDSPVEKSEEYIRIGKIKIALVPSSDCSLLHISADKFKEEDLKQKRQQIRDFAAESEKKSDFERLPEKYQKRLSEFSKALKCNDTELMMTFFLSLEGAGRGLTPAADDAIVGVLAGYLLSLSLEKKTDAYLETVGPILSHLCREKRTTGVSIKYLKCACRGAFSQDLCRLIRILSGEMQGDMKPFLERIRKVGHSSGMDMLYGLETML